MTLFFLSQNILAQLRTIFDLIINFQKIQDEMYTAAENELGERQAYVSEQNVKTKQVSLYRIFSVRSQICSTFRRPTKYVFVFL